MITNKFPPQAKLDIAVTVLTALSLMTERIAKILSKVKVIEAEE